MNRTRVGVLALLIGLTVIAPTHAAGPKAKTKRISITSGEQQRAGDAYIWKRSMSQNGRFVAFESDQKLVATDDSSTISDIYVRNRKTGKTQIVSVPSGTKEGGGSAFAPEISADGRFVVFEGGSETLVPFDSNNAVDVFRPRGSTRVTPSTRSQTSPRSWAERPRTQRWRPRRSTDGSFPRS